MKEIGLISEVDRRVFPHLMRHTFATTMLNAGASMSSIQHLLGHTTSMTTERYLDIRRETTVFEYQRYAVC